MVELIECNCPTTTPKFVADSTEQEHDVWITFFVIWEAGKIPCSEEGAEPMNGTAPAAAAGKLEAERRSGYAAAGVDDGKRIRTVVPLPSALSIAIEPP
jgi:hypothetical protein